MADGSLIPHKRCKQFAAVSEEGKQRWISANVTDVERPLLSVGSIVQAGCKVTFDRGGSYIEDPYKKERMFLEPSGGLYMLKMWVHEDLPSQTDKLFHGGTRLVRKTSSSSSP